MTTATGVGRQAQDYLAAVEHELADLSAEDRSALPEDLALHLEALTAEDDGRPLAVRLGDPVSYAADLRAAAGLPARRDGAWVGTADLRARWVALLATPAAQRVLPAARELLRLVQELRPAWWVLRGYLVVFVASAAELDGASDFPVPAPFGSPVLGLLLVVAAVAGSVALGRRTLPRPLNFIPALGGLVLILLWLAIWKAATDRFRTPPPLTRCPAGRWWRSTRCSRATARDRCAALCPRRHPAGGGAPLRPGRPATARRLPGVVGGQLRPSARSTSGGGWSARAELLSAVLCPRPRRRGSEPQHSPVGRQLRDGRATPRRPVADLPGRGDRPSPRRLTGRPHVGAAVLTFEREGGGPTVRTASSRFGAPPERAASR